MNGPSIIEQHYARVASRYQESFLCSDQYRHRIVDLIRNLFVLRPEHHVVDLGGGTGLTGQLLFERARLQHKVLCVDSSAAMLAQARGLPGVESRCMTAYAFAANASLRYDKLLLEGMVHHLSDRVALWQKVRMQLNPDGTILIITRPPRPPLPFFEAALASFAAGQPAVEILTAELAEAGFIADVHVCSFTFQLEKHTWYQLLRNRFMSNLNVLTDAEIEAGITELEGTYADQPILDMRDDLICILGK